MKTALILTQPLGPNYGGILQNYALQTVLLRFGYKPVNIDFWKKSTKRVVLNYVFFNRYINSISCQAFSIFFKGVLPRIKYVKMDLFLRRRINFISIEKNEFKIRKRIKHAENPIIIVGSDQVWRREYSPFLPFYFCSFLNPKTSCKHITYAASFGIDFWNYTDEETKMASKLIKSFDAVSVREKTAIDLCKNHLGYDKATWVPDPTMLLTQNDYSKLFPQKSCDSEPYIATYFLMPNEEKENMIDTVLSSLKIKRIDLSPKLQTQPLKSPEEWLACIKHAAYVITDSFHGTVFSLLFHKQFVVLHNTRCGETRLREILDLFNIKDRLFDDSDSINILNSLKTALDYSAIDKSIISFRKIGYDYLNNKL